MDEKEKRRPGAGAAHQQAGETEANVTRARRRWRLHQVGQRRRIAWAFEAAAGASRPVDAVQIDYRAAGLILGMPERIAAGRALLEQERAA